MRALLLLMALFTLAACSQTGRTTVYNSYTPGSGDYYTGIVPPTQF
ncbi:putative lipoprotein YmbA [Sinorhizobium fredii]